MAERSRRNFLRFGCVAAGAVATIPAWGGTASAREVESSARAYEGPFIAWVKDPRAGEIAVLVGENELIVRDKKLAKRLAQAAATAHRTG